MGPQFFQTLMGKSFFEGQVPKISKALTDIGAELKRANDLKEQELHAKQQESLDGGR